MDPRYAVLDDAARLAREFVESLPNRPVNAVSFQGRAVMRISVVGWQTTSEDIDRSADAILAAARAPG
jgi:hypothetical protein